MVSHERLKPQPGIVGRRLLALRRASGITQQELATRAGVAVATVQRTENGRGDPHIDTVEAFAAALGCPVTSLFAESDPEAEAS